MVEPRDERRRGASAGDGLDVRRDIVETEAADDNAAAGPRQLGEHVRELANTVVRRAV